MTPCCCSSRATCTRRGPTVGVNRGRVFVGDFGPDLRRAYTITDAVNLAARLMAKPEPDQILATDDVLSRSRTAFQTVALEPFQAEGTSEPPI